MKTVFEFDDYKHYLGWIERQRATFQRGFRTRLAEALNCQNAYISQVLNTHAHFGLEHGFKITEFLGLTGTEQKYFLLLIELERAGTTDLKKYFGSQLDDLRTQNLNITDKLPGAVNLSPESQAVYYSHWMYAAIHMLTTLETHRTIATITGSLRLPAEAVTNAILFLIQTGLLVEKKSQLYPGPTQLHIGKESPMVRNHLTNWRLCAIQALSQIENNDIHYSTVSSLSLRDAQKLKAHFVEEIESYVKTIQASPEETLYSFNLDFFSLLKD